MKYGELFKGYIKLIGIIQTINEATLQINNLEDITKLLEYIKKVKEDSFYLIEGSDLILDMIDSTSINNPKKTKDILLLSSCANIQDAMIELDFCEQNLSSRAEKMLMEENLQKQTKEFQKRYNKETKDIREKVENFRTSTLGQIISIMGVLIAIISIIITTLNGSNDVLKIYVEDCIKNGKSLFSADFYVVLAATPSIIIVFAIAFLLIISGLLFGDKSVRVVLGSIVLVALFLISAYFLANASIFISLLLIFFASMILLLLELKLFKSFSKK